MKKKSVVPVLMVLLLAALLALIFEVEKPDVTVYKDIAAALEGRTSRTEEQIYESFPTDDGLAIVYYDTAMDAYSMEQFVELEQGGCYIRESSAWVKAENGFTIHGKDGGFDIKAEPMGNGKMDFTLIES